MKSCSNIDTLGNYVKIRTGKLDANANDPKGIYPFFTCSVEPLRINSYSFDCECVLVAGNGDLNVKYYNGKFDAYQRTYVIESLDKSRLDVRYLFHFMEGYVQKLRELSIGGVIKYIKLNNLKDAEIPLPPLDKQLRIAAILDKADAIRRKRQESIRLTEEFLRSTFLEMFGDPVTNPKGWETFKMESLIVDGPQNGLYRHESDYGSGTPIIRIDSFYDGEITGLERLKRVRLDAHTVNKYLLREDDILVNRVNSRKFLGKCAIVPKLIEDTVFESNMMRFKIDKKKVCPHYLVSLFQQPYVKKQIDGRAKDAVNQSSINQDDVKSFEIRLPPLEIQMKFSQVKSAANNFRFRLNDVSVDDFNFFNSLTHRAFRGEL